MKSVKYKKIVIKIGTSVLAKKDGAIEKCAIEAIVSQVSNLINKGVEVIIVTSGAIGCGMEILKLKKKPSSLADLQAIASVGQNELMRIYSDFFARKKHAVGQILLTQEDFNQRARYLNIQYTIQSLLSKKILPIINENDSISTEEIKCGDNDRLSGLVADLSRADLLIMLTDVDGLYDKDGKVISSVSNISEDIKALAMKKSLAFTKGGMATKLEAAERVTSSGIDCIIANGRRADIIQDAISGSAVHTYFKAKSVKAKAKKRWIAYSSKVKGRIFVDDGAKTALNEKGKSLLASGIIKKEGSFEAGEVVGIVDVKGKEFARGLTNYSSKEIERVKGLKTVEIESVLGYMDYDEIVHRDNLVLL